MHGEPVGPSALLESMLQGGSATRIAAADAAVGFVRAAFREPHVQRERAVLTALVLLSCDGLVRAHVRHVLHALLESPLLDDAARIDLCGRILCARDPAEGLRPHPRVLGGEAGAEEEVFDLPDGRRLAIARRDLMLCRPLALPDAARRHAVVALADLGREPAALVRHALRAKVAPGTCGHAHGALDVIAQHSAHIPATLLRAALDAWRRAPVGAVKLRAYQVGIEVLGRNFARPALKDGDRMVRRWAEERLVP